MLGRLSSLPWTYAGAMILGLLVGYSEYVDKPQFVADGLQTSLPTLMLFAILIFVPQVRLRVGQVKGILAANVPSGRRAAAGAVALLVATLIVLPLLDATNTQRFGIAVVYAIIMLSLVLLTGYGGFVSLAQLSFVGVGATVVAKMDTSSPLAILVAVLLSAAVGALVALPVLRLTGLYLALATIAFGQLMDNLVFKSNALYGFGKLLRAKRLSLFGYDFDDTATYVFLLVVVFVLLSMGLLAVRRGAVGRLLIALRDSPAACGTLGLNERWFRVAVFSVSAGIAGLGGALLAGLNRFSTADDYQTMYSLLLLLAVVVAGVTTASGAFVGGMLLMLLPVLEATSKSLAGLEFLVIGLGAMLLGRDPNGLTNIVFTALRRSDGRLPLPERLRSLIDGAPRRTAPAEQRDEREELTDLEEPVGEREQQVAGHGVA
jgi:branched-chain amino acid transport system permease protein